MQRDRAEIGNAEKSCGNKLFIPACSLVSGKILSSIVQLSRLVEVGRASHTPLVRRFVGLAGFVLLERDDR